jgi:RND family efflux transporter MFP subunit
MKSCFGNLCKILAVALVIGLGVFWAAHHARAQAPARADLNAAPTAGVAKVTREDLNKEVTISGEFRPYEEVELHAKVSGYVDKMKVDFGDKVKAGQLMATLEVPELQDELENAQAARQKAEADYTNAHLIYTRLLSVNKDHPNLVAQQDLDTAQANDLTTTAAIAAAKAEVEKYQTMVSYTQITAPFDGIVTHRYADPGTLIQGGTSSGGQALPLVRVSDNYRLRLDFPVTVDYVKDVQVGDSVEVRVDSLNGKTFTSKISRFTHDVNEDTRTMTTEIEVPNPNLELMPGMYATVVLKVEKRLQVLAVPTEAVIGEKTPTVYVVNRDNQIEEHAVKLGLETPDKYEVLSGLHEGEMVVIGNRSGLQDGQKVEPKLIQLSMRDEN